MDDLERLQKMFPTVDGDVVAIVFNEYKNDVGVTIEMLKQLAPQVRLPSQQPQPPQPPQRRKTSEEKEWPSLANEAKSIPLQHQQGQESHGNVQGGMVPEPNQAGKQEWTQTNLRKSWNPRQKKSWNQTGKKGDAGGGNVWNQGVGAQGSNVPNPYASFHVGGNVQPMFPRAIDVRANFPPLNYGSQPNQMEPTGMGMWNRPRPNLDVTNFRMGSNSGAHSGSNPREMGYGQHRWMGYEGLPSGQERFQPLLQAPNAPLPLMTEPRPFPGLMPHPSMPGGYVYPAPMTNYHTGAVDSEQVRRSKSNEVDSKKLRGDGRSEHMGHLAYPVSHSHAPGLVSHSSGGVSISHSAGVVTRSHTSSPALHAVSQHQTSGALPRSYSASTMSHPHSAVAESHSHAIEESGKSDVRGKLILLRGLPGSGKTCLAKSLVGKNGVICSTDDFFMVQGRYVFDRLKLSEYHELNRVKAGNAMRGGKSPVIIDNTNSSAWEMKPYVLMAKEYNYSIEIREPNTPWRFKTTELARKNKHGVTRMMLDKLLDRFDHRVSIDSILKSERSEAKSSASQTSGPPNTPAPQTLKEPKLPSPQTSRTNFSSPKTSRATEEDVLPPAHKRGKLSPRQSGKFPKDGREGSGSRGGLTSSGSVADRCGSRASGDRRGTAEERRGTDIEVRDPIEEGCGEDLGEMVDSIVRGVTPDVSELVRDELIPFREHHVAKTTMGCVATQESSNETRHLTESRPKSNVPELVNGDKQVGVASEAVGVASEVKDDKYGVTYGITEPKIVVTKAMASGVTKDRVASSGRASIGVIGEGRGKKKAPVSAKQGVNEKGEWPDVKKGSESDAEDLTNDQWDSSEEADLLGEVESDEERDSDGYLRERERELVKDEDDGNADLEADIEEEGVVFGGSKGRLEENEGKKAQDVGGNVSAKATPISPDQWRSGSSEVDMWKPHSDLFRKKKSKYSLLVEGALASTQHPKYSMEGEVDERNFSLSHQNLLVGQLMSEHRTVCALAEELINPWSEDLVSLKCLLQSSKFSGFHSYLPDAVVEQVLKDRGLVPSLWSLMHSPAGGVGMKQVFQGQRVVQNPAQASRKLSKLLKIASASAESRKMTSPGGDLDEDDPAIVQKVPVAPVTQSPGGVAESAKEPAKMSASAVVVNDPSIVSISPLHPLSSDQKSRPTAASAGDTWTSGGYDSEDPLPNDHIPSVFPSALPTNDGYSEGKNKNLGDLFAAFSSAGVVGGMGGVSENSSSAQDEFLTPPQSPTAALWGGGVATKAGKETSGTNGVSSTKNVKGISGEAKRSKQGDLKAGVMVVNGSAKSHDPGLKPGDSKKISVQELEQLMTNSEEAYFSADSGDNAGPNLARFQSKTRRSTENGLSAGTSEVMPSASGDPLPTLEKWVWQKGPSSKESWSPGSDSVTADSAIAIPTSSDDANPSDALQSKEGDEHVEDTSGAQYSVIPTGEPGADMLFLVECFPDLEEGYLERLLIRNQGNVEETVSMALLSSMAGTPLSPLSGNTYFEYRTQTSDESSKSGGSVSFLTRAEDFEGTANDEVLARTLQDKLDHDTKGCGVAKEGVLHLENGGLYLGSKDDEEIARILQEELNHSDAGTEHVQSDSVTLRDGAKPLHDGMPYLETVTPINVEDDNLVLKLTPSLARQLQNLFGPVKQHLPNGSLTVDSDLEVLLSERAAREIYQKWVDTLEAKRIGYRVQSQLLLDGSEPRPPALDQKQQQEGADGQRRKVEGGGGTPTKAKKKKKKKYHSEPLVLEFGEHNKVEKTTPPSAWVPKESPPTRSPGPLRGLLQLLHQKFPFIEHVIVNQVLVDNKFDKEDTIQQLTLIQEGKIPPPNVIRTVENVPLPPPYQATPTGAQGSRRSHSYKPAPARVDYRKLRRDEEEGDHLYQVIGDPSYNDMRAESALHAKLRAENFQKAAHARSKKQYEVAVYYAQQGHLHTDRMKEANERAAAYTLQFLNEKRGSNQIDLHGLHVDEALEALKEKIGQTKAGTKLQVVTGYGSHSKSREARIKPAVLGLLKNYGFKYEERNPGLFQVVVK